MDYTVKWVMHFFYVINITKDKITTVLAFKLRDLLVKLHQYPPTNSPLLFLNTDQFWSDPLWIHLLHISFSWTLKCTERPWILFHMSYSGLGLWGDIWRASTDRRNNNSSQIPFQWHVSIVLSQTWQNVNLLIKTVCINQKVGSAVRN